MGYFIDVSYGTLTKYGEELPGDMVNISRPSDYTVIVMADGLGSGVKANILSTLTSKIAGTMLKKGADIYETVDTIAKTLPVCKVRNIAYSTFTILKIYDDGRTYITEYDNPPTFIMPNKQSVELEENELVINERTIKERYLKLDDGDTLVVASDGVIHAGLGNILNLGWQWDDVNNYLKKVCSRTKSAKIVADDLLESCWDLYNGKPGDDTTVIAVKVRKPSYVNLFAGPPNDRNNDSYVIKEFIKSNGKKIICGGTAANIAERELKRKLNVSLEYFSEDIPPTASMEGIDLITEGVLTLSKVIEKIRAYMEPVNTSLEKVDFGEMDGASQLFEILIEDCTHLNLWVGMAINPAHQNPNFPSHLSIKLKLLEEICDLMKRLGKEVNIKYV